MIQLQDRVLTQEMVNELKEKTIYFRAPYSGFTVYYLKEDNHLYRILLNAESEEKVAILELFNTSVTSHNRLTRKEKIRIIDTYLSELLMEEFL